MPLGFLCAAPLTTYGAFRSSKIRSSSPRGPKLFAARRPLIVVSKAKDNKPEGAPVDWDSDWNTFKNEDKTVRREVKSNNVFQLPDEGRQVRNDKDVVDDRTNRLTSAWTSESGYLFGIALIAAIACLEGYVWWTSQH